MSAVTKRILFIGHEASRTGAPIVLLDLLRWINVNSPGFEMDLLLLRGGPLVDAFREAANVYVLPEKEPTIFTRIKRKLGIRPRLVTDGLAPFEREYDVVFSNTIVTAEYLKFFKERGSRTICWVHELRSTLSSFWSDSEFIEFARFIDTFLVVSKAVGAMLAQIGIETNVHLAHPFLSFKSNNIGDSRALKTALGIPEGAFIIGGSGSIEFRKGIDLFVKIATPLVRSHENFYFVWVGGKSIHERPTYDEIQRMVEDSALTGRVIVTGVQENPLQYFAIFDVFALTSREEPFGLVGLEAASLGKPIICFDDAGGAPEYVKDRCGFAVPYLNTYLFAEKIIELYSNPGLRKALGKNAYEMARNDFNIERLAEKILKIIEDTAET